MSSFLEFEVGTADLRRGMQAVLPHVNGDKDAPDTHRVRIEVGADAGDGSRRVGAEQAARRAEDAVDERLAAAVRFVGARQVVTLKGLRGELGIGQAETQSVLTDMEARGLIGPKIGRKAQPALFSPDEVDAVLRAIAAGDRDGNDLAVTAATLDELGGSVPDIPAGPVESSGLDEFAPVPTDWAGQGNTIEGNTLMVPPGALEKDAEKIPVIIPPVTDGGPADDHTADPFRDSDGNAWPTRDPFDAA